MDKLQQVRAFQSTVEAGSTALDVLLGLLRSEHRALLHNDAAALDAAVAGKEEQLRNLQHAVTARDRLLAALGLPSGPAGAMAFLDRMQAPPAARRAWDRHQELNREAAERNTRNGRLVARAERTTRKALSILTGRGVEQDTYQRGRKRYPGMPRASLGKV